MLLEILVILFFVVGFISLCDVIIGIAVLVFCAECVYIFVLGRFVWHLIFN